MPLNPQPFTHQEAVNLWARLVAGWANSLDNDGARTLMDGHPNPADSGGSYEGVTRMLWGLGSWLSQPDRSSTVTWRGETYDIEALTRRALVNGCDPTSPSYWGVEYDPATLHDQRTVETGQIAFALWQSRARIWDTLSSSEQTHIYDFLERFARPPVTTRSNWSLFWVLNHACRKALGLPYDQSIIDTVIEDYLDSVYAGDGWYDDAHKVGVGYFDDYNLWVFGSHVLAWAQVDGHTKPERRDELLERIRLLMEKLPYFFASSGAYSEFGRSLAYKFARLGAPLWAYKLGAWPYSVGQLRRLVGRHLRWYVDRGAIRNDGTLRQSLTATGSPEIVERYISTGATYWAMQAFGGLWTLPDDDPFWTADEEPLPAETENFRKVYAQPGWILQAHEGDIQRFNAGSMKGLDAKYAKFVYSTQFPFNVGLSNGMPSPDNMLCLVDGEVRGQRTKNVAFAVHESGWLRFVWEQVVNGITHTIDTVIVVLGEQHLRAHRIQVSPDQTSPLKLVEGCSPLGYSAGEVPIIRQDKTSCTANLGLGRATGIYNISGYDEATLWQGAPHTNSVHPYDVLPVLTVNNVLDGHTLLCLVHGGQPFVEIDIPNNAQGIWQDDGHFHLIYGTLDLVIPNPE
ncbi:MAG: DUF2264 domain-containing protein [Anaerolineae bacterium]|nr:DUF2264 domain-containing protein [Anaerolineae bacterium]